MNKGLVVMSLKSFVNNKAQWDAFCEELDILILEQQRRLEQSEVAIDYIVAKVQSLHYED